MKYGPLLIMLLVIFSLAWGRKNPIGEKNLNTIARETYGSPAQTVLNINNISAWIWDDGISGHNPIIDASGVIYPRGTAGVIFQDGIVWGGYSRDGLSPSLRVGGQTYDTGMTPGRIISVGNPQNPNDPEVRIYRIRPDWQTVSDDELIPDAAELLSIDPSQVTQSQIDAVRAQYDTDWSEWPVDMGAPFYDLNDNGIYEPAMGETPGIADGDQVIWFVSNDLDPTATFDLYGSPPMGIELQVTMWGYDASGYLGETTFRRYRLINKSGYPIDSMYVAQWSDPDLGNSSDDFVGCDTALSLGYCYNSAATDNEFSVFVLAPPSIGYDFLQGPIIPSSGDTATFNFRGKPDYRNLQMTSFSWFAAGSDIDDPPLGQYNGTLEWYNMLNGFTPTPDLSNPTPYLHGSGALAGLPTKFPLNGDPVRGIDDIDGQGNNYSPSDRRMALSSGPFTMQPGDTQEVVIGLVGGISGNNLMSITSMKNNDISAQYAYNSLLGIVPSPPTFSATLYYIDSTQTNVHFKAINEDISSIGIIIKQYNGAQVVSLPLYDDGFHGDGNANDGIWGNDWLTTPMAMGLYIDALVNYCQDFNYNYEKIYEHLSTSGPVSISQFLSGSDNLNHDGIANPGENIRYTLAIQNFSSKQFSEVEIKQIKALEFQFIHNLNAPNGNEVISNFSASDMYSWNYSETSNFYQFDIDNSFAGNDSIHLVLQLTDNQYNLWQDTVAVWVAPLQVQPREQLMTKVSGNCYGQLGYRLIDPNLITGDSYQVSFNDTLPDGTILYDLRDLITGNVLLTDQPYPDQYGHNSQVIDGFIITRGTTVPINQIGAWNWFPPVFRWLTGIESGFPVFFGGVCLGKDYFGSTLSEEEYHSVKIIFRSTLQTNCAVYRQDLGLTYNGIGTFYGEVYDISDTLNPRRVNVVFMEYNTPEKPADMIWNPDTSELGGREYLFIMDSDYDPETAGGYDDNNKGYNADVVWVAFTRISDGYTFLQSSADFYLYFFKGVRYGDVFRFTPQWTGINPESQGPVTFQLSQNYPNPFNPVTHFRFSLAHQVKVKLEIFNVLGQRVKMLVDKEMPAGEYQMQWDGRNDAGNNLGSGLYFYRISAGDFVKNRKMILLK